MADIWSSDWSKITQDSWSTAPYNQLPGHTDCRFSLFTPLPLKRSEALRRACDPRRHAIMRPGLQLVTCPTDSGYRDRIFLPIGSLALLDVSAWAGHRARPVEPADTDTRATPRSPKRALCVFFLSGDAHGVHVGDEGGSVCDDARLEPVRSLNDEWGERRKGAGEWGRLRGSRLRRLRGS